MIIKNTKMRIERRGYMSEESNLKDIIVIKRNGKKVPFDETKITENMILKTYKKY